MTIDSRNQLPQLMQELNLPMVAAEVGVAEGRFSEILLQGGLSTLYLVDMWGHIPNQHGDSAFDQQWHDDNLVDCVFRLSQYNFNTIFLRGDSVLMADSIPDNSLGMVYLDADHSYEGVKRDLEAWYPKVVTGGIIAGHDYLNVEGYGANRAVNEFATGRFDIVVIPENEPNNASFYFIKP